jgi:hypothetical protein
MRQLTGLLSTYRWLQCAAMRPLRWLALGTALLAGACGGDPPPPKEVPAGDIVRTLYGLNPGSCYRYEQLGQRLYATFDVAGPNTNSIAGRTVYVRSYRLDAGGRPVEEYFATDAEGEIRLIRKVDNMGNVSRYEMDEVAPLFAKFEYNIKKEALMKTGDRFMVTAQPKDLPAEMHEWTVKSDAKMIVTTDGEKVGYDLQYRINAGTPSTWQIVPGYGVASFVDFNGVTHQVCDARICDASGVCTGAADCLQLACP